MKTEVIEIKQKLGGNPAKKRLSVCKLYANEKGATILLP